MPGRAGYAGRVSMNLRELPFDARPRGLRAWAVRAPRLGVAWVVAVALGALVACSDRLYVCESDAQCVWNGLVGRCDAQASVCAYPDESCDSDMRFGPYAGGLSQACVEPEGATGATTTTGGEATEGEATGSETTAGDEGPPPIPLPPIDGTIWHVDPQGDDDGAGTPDDPFATLQRGLEAAMPGDGVELADGDYESGGESVRDGLPDAPIVIYGSALAVLHESVRDDVLVLAHDHHVVHGLTIDGLHGDPLEPDGYAEQLVVVRGPVESVRLLGLGSSNALDECVRLVDHVRSGEIAGCTIRACGLGDHVFDGDGKNGEGIYIGTGNEGWDDSGPDDSSLNWVHDNVIDTQGNECVDVQEGSSGNVIEDNTCTGLHDGESGGISIRGNGNVVRGNRVEGCIGAGVRLGGDDTDGVTYGVDNEVTGNTIVDNTRAGVKIEDEVQAAICGNVLEGNGMPSGGSYGDQYDPAAPC